MCPKDVVRSSGSGSEEQQEHLDDRCEKTGKCSRQAAQEMDGHGKDPHDRCSTLPNGACASPASAAEMGGRDQEEILSKMRDACERQNCSTKDVSDATLLRFLEARSMKVDKAAKMFVQHQSWRASYIPLGYVPDSECPRELASQKLFLQGRSKRGWAVVLVHVRNHQALHRDMEELKRLIILLLDKAIASAAPEAEKLMVIVDLKDTGYRNLDARAFIAGFEFVQAYYPERLARCLLINAPSIFIGMWKFISRFLDAATKSKISFIGHDQVRDTCLSDIGMDVLPAMYGGKAKLTLLQDAIVPNWPPCKDM